MRALFLAAALLLPSGARAQDALRTPDLARLEAFDATLGRALAGALAAGSPQDVAILVAALAGEPGPLDPAGDWSCRTLKLGGLLPLVAYPPFRCRVAAAGPGLWRLEKLTGSQRLLGTIGADGLYTGVGFVGEAPATDYAGLPPLDQEAQEPGQTHAQVGRFEQAGPGQARLLLPAPLLESEFDVLWLSR